MEFLFPVRYSGIKHARVQADTLEEAIQKAQHEADLKASFELNLSDAKFDVLAPRLALTPEQMETWPYWEYWYTGTDGVDWRAGYTKDGKGSIPDYAESFAPVPSDWLESWKE